jgi:hypothetical protein
MTMSLDQYLIDGEWVKESKARELLYHVAHVLIHKGENKRDRDGGALIENNWRSVAARPTWSKDLIARAHKLQPTFCGYCGWLPYGYIIDEGRGGWPACPHCGAI